MRSLNSACAVAPVYTGNAIVICTAQPDIAAFRVGTRPVKLSLFAKLETLSMILDEKLSAGDVIVLDGATGTEIARVGGKLDSVAWCAVANKTHPDTVRRVHESYLNAGADVITTNTFATCRHVLDGAGLAAETVAINRRAVELAREARENVATGRPVAIAGSMSTTFAWALDTFSPDPRYLPAAEQESANYREMADTLAEAGCDLLMMEMMGDVDRARRATEAAIATGLPVWLGLTCSQKADGSILGFDLAKMPTSIPDDFRGPESPAFQDVIDALVGLGVQAAGVMHSSVEDTTPGLEMLYPELERTGHGLPRNRALRRSRQERSRHNLSG